jgi:perosamine synthetase
MMPLLGEEEQNAAAEAIASGWVAQGPRVAEFERCFADQLGVDHAVAVSSCTTALHLALVVAGVVPGDEVIVPSLSFIATANVVRHAGAEPVFADVDLTTQNLTPEIVEDAITPATRAVIVVDQAGMPADVTAIRAVCDPRGIVVVEDAACAIGSTYHGRAAGAAAQVAAYSFHPRKIVTTGEGGMVVTDDAAWADRLALLRQHGMSISAADRHAAGSAPLIEQYLEVGFNYRMTDIQAAVGIVQLGRLDEVVTRRRLLAQRYRDLLGDLDVLLPSDPAWGTTNYQSFWVLLPDELTHERNSIMTEMGAAGISTRRGIMAAHLEPAWKGHPHPPLPVTERLTHGSIILPLFHQLSDDDQERVAVALRDALEARR